MELPKCPHSPCSLNDIRKSDEGLASGSVWGGVSSSSPSSWLLHALPHHEFVPTCGKSGWWGGGQWVTVGRCLTSPLCPHLCVVPFRFVLFPPHLLLLLFFPALCLRHLTLSCLRLTSVSPSFCLGLSSTRITGCPTLGD